MIKLYAACIMLMLSAANANAQYKYSYYLNKDLAVVKPADAFFTGKGMQENDLFRLDCFNKRNKLLITAHFTDSALNIREGSYESYFADHSKESTGSFKYNLRDGILLTWDSTGLLTDSVLYETGRMKIRSTYVYDPKGHKESYEHTDSIADTYTYIYYGRNTVLMLAEFKGNNGTLTTYDSTGTKKSTEQLTSRKMQEAEFPGGRKAFKAFLEKNMNGMVATNNNAPSGTYTVMIRFIVEKDGSIYDIWPETHVGYGMEKECMRVIGISPDWIPASQFGRPVRAYRRQPFSFMVAKE